MDFRRVFTAPDFSRDAGAGGGALRDGSSRPYHRHSQSPIGRDRRLSRPCLRRCKHPIRDFGLPTKPSIPSRAGAAGREFRRAPVSKPAISATGSGCFENVCRFRASWRRRRPIPLPANASIFNLDLEDALVLFSEGPFACANRRARRSDFAGTECSNRRPPCHDSRKPRTLAPHSALPRFPLRLCGSISRPSPSRSTIIVGPSSGCAR